MSAIFSRRLSRMLAELANKMIGIVIPKLFGQETNGGIVGQQLVLGCTDSGLDQVVHGRCTEGLLIAGIKMRQAHLCKYRHILHTPRLFRMKQHLAPHTHQHSRCIDRQRAVSRFVYRS